MYKEVLKESFIKSFNCKVLLGGLLWGIPIGVLLYTGFHYLLEIPDIAPLHIFILISLIYAYTFNYLGSFSISVLDQIFPYRNYSDIVAQVAFRSAYLVVAFIIPTVIVQYVLPLGVTIINWGSGATLLILVVSLGAGIVGNIFHQLVAFYEEKINAEKTAREAELSALKAQIKPHFLFNSLNSIASLIRTNPQKAEKVTENLADLFRYSLASDQEKAVTLEEELEAAKTYLEIEKARFGDHIRLHCDIETELEHLKVPSFTFQPLVENAVKHSLKNKQQDDLQIYIEGKREGECIKFKVTDNGSGFETPDRPEVYLKNGHGLYNVRNRWINQTNGLGEMTLKSNGVALTLPYHATTS